MSLQGTDRRPAGWLAVALLGGLGACAMAPPEPSLTPADYAIAQEVLARSPQARAELEQDCLNGTASAAPERERAAMAAVLEVPSAEVPRVFCTRLVAAIARGDLTHADYEALQSGSEDPAFMHRLVRILRMTPGQYAI